MNHHADLEVVRTGKVWDSCHCAGDNRKHSVT